MAHTTNGGRTWCALTNPGDLWRDSTYAVNSFQAIHYYNAKKGIAFDRNGSWFNSSDGGGSWTKFESAVEPRGMVFLNNNVGWVVVEDGLYRIDFP